MSVFFSKLGFSKTFFYFFVKDAINMPTNYSATRVLFLQWSFYFSDGEKMLLFIFSLSFFLLPTFFRYLLLFSLFYFRKAIVENHF